jgi:hypothetical protein
MNWLQLFTAFTPEEKSEKIFLVRLESGENIAQYTDDSGIETNHLLLG